MGARRYLMNEPPPTVAIYEGQIAPDDLPTGCYVYALEFCGVVRYVGKGTDDRAWRHLKPGPHHVRRKARACLERGEPVRVLILAENLSDAAAVEKEAAAIMDRPPDQLWNVYERGDERALTDETRERMRAAALENWAKPEFREERSALIREGNRRPEVRARRSVVMRKALSRAEAKANQRRAAKLTQARPEVKAKVKAGIRAAWARPEVRAKHTAAAVRRRRGNLTGQKDLF